MRKNTARHWLHAALDLLPVILIPVFMIYSHRHVMTEQTTVDIQYKYQSNEVNSIDDLLEGNIYHLNLTNNDLNNLSTTDLYCYLINGYIEGTVYESNIESIGDFYLTESQHINLYYDTEEGHLQIFVLYGDDIWVNYSLSNFVVNIDFVLETYNEGDINITASDFNVIENVDVQDTNSSIMNVFMDDFNYSVNKYFNMGNVFNLKDVYHWFEVNIFNNNPPVVMASIYNIIVYEFVMDLLFLLYGLFMWFIDMLKRLIEKPIDSIK